MNPQWRRGLREKRRSQDMRRPAVILGILVLGGLGWLYGSKLAELSGVTAEVRALQDEERALLRERAELRERLEEADDPGIVEAEARRVLGWGYEGEEKLILPEE